jgi:hypothetical protein
VKVAVTDSPEFITTVHAPVPLQPAPDQPLKVDPGNGVALRVTWLPCRTLAEQVPGQLIPPPVTVPDPDPASVTFSISAGTGVAAKVAVTDFCAVIVTVQVDLPLQPAPDQPENVDAALAVAVSTTFRPFDSTTEQVLGQEMPPPATRPVPLPASATVRRLPVAAAQA